MSVTYPYEHPRDALLRVAQSVDGRDRVCIVLAAPGKFPTAADRPRSEADQGDVQVRISPLSGVHDLRLCGSSQGDDPQLFEVTRDQKVVWTFKDFKTFGNVLA